MRARLVVDDEVDVALAHPGLGVGEAVVLLRQRAQALGGRSASRSAMTGQLAAPGGDDLALDAHVVAEVDVALPAGPATPRRRWSSEIMTCRSPRAVADRGEAELAARPAEHDPARDPDPLAGRGVRLQALVFLPDLGDGRGTRESSPGRGRRPRLRRRSSFSRRTRICSGSEVVVASRSPKGSGTRARSGQRPSRPLPGRCPAAPGYQGRRGACQRRVRAASGPCRVGGGTAGHWQVFSGR